MDREQTITALKAMADGTDVLYLRKSNLDKGLPEDTPMEIGIRLMAEKGELQGIRDHYKVYVQDLNRIRKMALAYVCELPGNIYADDALINVYLLARVFIDYPEPSQFDQYLRRNLGLSGDAPLLEYLRASVGKDSEDPFKEYNLDLLLRLATIIDDCNKTGTILSETIVGSR